MLAFKFLLFWFLRASHGHSDDDRLRRRAHVFGGGFGTMPAFAADYFGSRTLAIYG